MGYCLVLQSLGIPGSKMQSLSRELRDFKAASFIADIEELVNPKEMSTIKFTKLEG